MPEDRHDLVGSAADEKPEPVPHAELSDARLLEAETMSQRLAIHSGATPRMRRLAEDLVAALRRATEEQRIVEGLIVSRAGQEDAPAMDLMRNSLDELDARAGELLGALAVLHGVIVRGDGREAARALVEAQRALSELQALEDGARMLGEDEG